MVNVAPSEALTHPREKFLPDFSPPQTQKKVKPSLIKHLLPSSSIILASLLRRAVMPIAVNPLQKMSTFISPSTTIPILTSVAQVRAWREERLKLGEKVGFVPTMGALHQGHLSLVKSSLLENESTIVSIFVNPAQFAPHEDLGSYPRTLESDLEILESIEMKNAIDLKKRRVSALFLPPAEALYPGGITTDVKLQRGTFIEVKGLQDSMEGGSRPGFFRGVATVCLKLFNIIQPTKAYFGQKDIQQALLLRRMLSDLHVISPSPKNLIINPTYRNPDTGLALSSRNVYLSELEMKFSTVLIDSLRAAELVWQSESRRSDGVIDVKKVLAAAKESVRKVELEGKKAGVEVKLMYILLNDPTELSNLEEVECGLVKQGFGAVLSGAVMLGKTRLIDNLLFDYDLN